jgi:hypothetical protein
MKYMYANGIKLSAVLVALGLAACSGSGTSPKGVSTANVATNTLQLNVGTANIGGVAGTNVVVTYRQPSGQSGTLVNSPTLTFPTALAGPAGTADGFDSTIVTGPAAAEIGTTSATSTSQNATNATTFGVSGGAFGLGLEPFNYGNLGTPDNVASYQVPLYDKLGYSHTKAAQDAAAGSGPCASSCPVDPNAFLPIGGLPAFDPSGNQAAVLAGVNGVSEGLDVFAVTPAVGTYGLAVANPGAAGASATAAMTSAALLPTITAPPVPAITANGATGGGSDSATFAYVQPPGAIEGYVQVTDFGPTTAKAASCLGASTAKPIYYTVALTASGTATLPAGSLCSAADNTTATKSASDGDAFTVQVIAFDYHAYEISYPNSLGVPAPSIVGAGASHQADVTISPQVVYNLPAGGGIPVVGPMPSSSARHSGTALTRN